MSAKAKGPLNIKALSLCLAYLLLPAALSFLLAGPLIAQASKAGLSVSSASQTLPVVLLSHHRCAPRAPAAQPGRFLHLSTLKMEIIPIQGLTK